MDAATRVRLIRLMAVAKAFSKRGSEPTVVFRPTTITLPGDRRMAILGGRNEGKTVLLQLLAQTERPDHGRVVAPLRLSPVVNGDRLFHPNLSGLENVRFYARRFGVDEDRLLLAMDSFLRLGPILEERVGGLTIKQRRGIETALAAALAFDCYLVDDLGMLASDLAERTFEAAAQRRAGVIFATGSARLARHYADCAVVIQNHTLHPFNRIEEATRFYERE